MLIYRTGGAGGPRLVKSFAAAAQRILASGTDRSGGRPAPPGTYLFGSR